MTIIFNPRYPSSYQGVDHGDFMTKNSLQAGVSQVDITPEKGVQVAGAVCSPRPAKFIADPIFAKALVLASGDDKLCIVSADLTIITRKYSEEVRRWAGELGFDRNAVMVHATQTHSAPAIGHFILSDEFEIPEEFEWLKGSTTEYSEFATEAIKKAIRFADEALEPVELGYGSGIEGRLAFNRRAILRNGSIHMPGPTWKPPVGNADILYIEGPIDPEVGVICLRNSARRFPAVLVNYACHPVHVFPKPIISPDWPGALSDEVRELYGEGCIPIVINGPCGNINPWPPFDPDYVEDHRAMGKVLSKTVEKVIEMLEFSEVSTLGFRSQTLKLPIRDIDPEMLAAAMEKLEKEPQPTWVEGKKPGVAFEWVMAAMLVDLHNLKNKSGTYDYEVQVFRIGDVAIVGLPGEPFVEGGLWIKLNSPTRPTFVAHDVNHYAGYLPIREAYDRGGHETHLGNWSRFKPDALEVVVETATDILGDMFRDDGASGEEKR
jgi:hypothetical protein